MTPYIELYQRLYLTRVVEETIARVYAEQQIRCPMHLCIGQEAISAGACGAVEKNDAIFATHRSHGPYIAGGGDLRKLFAELYGKKTGCCAGRGGSMHLTDLNAGYWAAVPIVGSTIPIATGVALAFQMQKKRNVSIVFLGEGATEEGVFHESIQYAALKKLPIIYVCENNGFSVCTPLSERRAPNLKIYELAKAHGLPAKQNDGNNAIAVYHDVKEAVEYARSGGGATFLEFATYRWLEHCGHLDDHHLPCRSPEEFTKWKKRCPVAYMQNFLLDNHHINQAELSRIEKESNDEVNAALIQAQTDDFPEIALAPQKVYALN